MSGAWGEPPWSAALEAPPARVPERVDAAVVGAGLTGLAAARVLAEAGLSVAVLEANRVGAGASGRTGGLVLEGAAAGDLEGIGDCLPALETRVRDAEIACDLRLDGCLELVHAEPGREAARPIAWRDGERVLCVAEEVEGGTLDPRALLAGLLRGALDAGAVVCEGARVTHLGCAPGPVLHHGGGRLACDRALVALNAWTAQRVPELPGLRSALTLALATAPLPIHVLDALGLGDRRPFYTLDSPYLWGRVLPDRGVLFGSGLVFAPAADLGGLDLRRGELAEALARLEGPVRRRVA